MDFSRLRHLKPDVSLKVVERDLSGDEFKPEFSEEDLKIDYSVARLSRAEIEIPIVKDTFIHPFSLKGKLVQYFMKNLGGGFYEFVFQNGKMQPKPSDRRHPDKEIDRNNGGEIKFWIGYDHEKRHYYYTDQEETFKERYKVVEEALLNEETFLLLSDFKRFITYFYSSEFLTAHRMKGAAKATVQDYRDIFVYLKNALPMLRDYHTLLNIMNDIDDITLSHNLAFFEKWENSLEHHLHHMRRHLDLNWTLEESRNHWTEFSPISNFYGTIETDFWKAGYYIDPVNDGIYPNFLEIHNQRQLAKGPHFESDETLRQKEKEYYEKHMEAAKSKQQVLFIKTE